jgi:hypothetical protein
LLLSWSYSSVHQLAGGHLRRARLVQLENPSVDDGLLGR